MRIFRFTVPMPFIILLFIFSLSFVLFSHAEVEELSLESLEQKLVDIDEELEELAPFNLRSGAGSIGYRSIAKATSNHRDWFQVDLGSEILIDEVVLVPCLWRSTQSGFEADGFPLDFKIIAGHGDEEGVVIASFTEEDGLLPRIAPLVVPCTGTMASWVRVEVTRLSPWGWANKYISQFSELLVFSGSQNVALKRPVTSANKRAAKTAPWGTRYLTDGFVPYFMDGASGEKSNAYSTTVSDVEKPSLTIDLKEECVISSISVHGVDLGNTVPQSSLENFGMPKHLQIEVASNFDFSDSKLLVNYKPSSIYETGPVISWNVPNTRCRYIRLTAIEPYTHEIITTKNKRFGFAEIEVYSEGSNIALGKSVNTNYKKRRQEKALISLTDGNNFYGEILPVRRWMNELAIRHALEAERSVVLTELSLRYATQKENLNRLFWVIALLIAGIGFLILAGRLIRHRQVANIKERLSADLHDELGANIHSIGMLSDIAQDSKSQSEWESMHQRILSLVDRASMGIRYCTNVLEAEGLYIGLVDDMERTAERVIANFKHDFFAEGHELIEKLRPRTRVDIFLFYKECLVNICRHSNANEITTKIKAEENRITLTVTDNGKGMQNVPPSLKRRAQLMRGQIKIDEPIEGGATILLQLPIRRNWLIRKLLPRA